MLRIASSAAWLLILGLYDSCLSDKTGTTFTFKEYQYKDSPKNEMTFHEFETACEQSSACNQMTGLAQMRCVRECVSPSCYREIYSSDPVKYTPHVPQNLKKCEVIVDAGVLLGRLEEGEIDVRLNSFKGCFVQRSGRTRN